MARTVVEWFPAGGGDRVTFTTGDEAAYRLQRLLGIEPVTIEPVSVKSPNQPGMTAVDIVVPPRVVTVVGMIQSLTVAGAQSLRAALARSVAQQPTRLGETYQLGRLRVTRDGLEPLEIDCLPRSIDIARPAGTKSLAPFDLEFLAPFPYWRPIADSQVLFSAAGGFTFPLVFLMDMESNNVEVEIDNPGDVDSPILARLYGDITTARIKNLTTGETLEVEGNLPAGKYWEISTAFGDKRVEEVTVATGARVSAMAKIDLNLADFWSLRPGVQVVKFEADVNTSGRAELYWRARYSGI